MESLLRETDLRDTSDSANQQIDSDVKMASPDVDDSHNTTDDAIETILMAEEDARKEASAINTSAQCVPRSVITTLVVNAPSTSFVRSGNSNNIVHTQTRGLHTIVTPIPANVPNVIRSAPLVLNSQNTSSVNFVTINAQNATTIPNASTQATFNPIAVNKLMKGQPVQFLAQDGNPEMKTAMIAKKPMSTINFKPGDPSLLSAGISKPQTTFQNNITLSPVKGGFKIPISPLRNFKNPLKLSFLPNPNANAVKIDAGLANNTQPVLSTSNFQFQTLVTPQTNRIAVNNGNQQSISQNIALPANLQGGKVQCLRLVPTGSSQQTTGIPISNLLQTQTGSSTLPVKAAVVQQQQVPASIQPFTNSPAFHKTVTVSQPPAKTQRLIMPAKGGASTGPHNNPPAAVTNLSPGSVLQAGSVGYAMVPAKYVEELKKQLNSHLLQANKIETTSVPTPTESISPQPPKISVNGKVRKPCNCTKSMCLKLYCECFANGHFCDNCNCINCHNNVEFDGDRSKAIKSCLERNPSAFKPKIGRGGDDSRTHQKGCNCKRSGCLKNYCECYEARIPCTSKCKCIGCKNIGDDPAANGEQPSLMNLADAAAVRCQQQAAASSRINSQMKDIRSGRQKAQANLNSGDRLPCMFFTQDIIEATCTCLLAQAEEAEKTNRSTPVAETMILEEFGRCLMQIIQAAAKAKPPTQS